MYGVYQRPSMSVKMGAFLKVAVTVTRLAGILKVYLPSPLSVSSSALPFLSVTVRSASLKPSSGLTVMVTVLPFFAFFTSADTLPFSVLPGVLSE